MGERQVKLFQKTVALIAAAAVAISACASCSSDSAVRRIKQNGGLRVGYCSCGADQDAPFVIEKADGLTGEPASKTADSFGTNAVFTRVSTSEAYDKLLFGSVDCLWNCPPPSKELVSSLRTVETGLYYRQVIMITKDSKIERLADIKGKKLAVVSGSDAQTELHKASVMEGSLKQIIVFDTIQQILEALASGKVHCAAVDEPQAVYAAANFSGGDQGKAEFKFVETPIAECSLVIVTRADDADLCSIIAEKYVGMAQDGKIREICEKYGMERLLTSSIKDNPAEESI